MSGWMKHHEQDIWEMSVHMPFSGGIIYVSRWDGIDFSSLTGIAGGLLSRFNYFFIIVNHIFIILLNQFTTIQYRVIHLVLDLLYIVTSFYLLYWFSVTISSINSSLLLNTDIAIFSCPFVFNFVFMMYNFASPIAFLLSSYLLIYVFTLL